MTTTALEKLRDSQAMEVHGSPTGQALLEQGHTIVQQRLDKYMTAVSVQKPRDNQKIIKAVEFEAEMLAAKAYYSWTTNGKGGRSLVEGPTIDLAMVLIRNWGNCAGRADLVAETPTHYLFDGIFLDVESGVTIVRQYKMNKDTSKFGRMDADRARDIVFQIGQSKAIRNACLAGVPTWLVDKAVRRAKASAAKTMTPEKVLGAFDKWGIDQRALEKKLGKAVHRWDEMDMATLRGVYQALLDGMTTIENEFGQEQAAENVASAVRAKAAASTREVVDPETGEVTQEPAEQAQPPQGPPENKPPQQEAQPHAPEPQGEPEQANDTLPKGAQTAIAEFEKLGVKRYQLEAMVGPAAEWRRPEMSKLRTLLKQVKESKDPSELFETEKEREF